MKFVVPVEINLDKKFERHLVESKLGPKILGIV